MTPKTPSLTAYDLLGYTVPGLGLIAIFDISFVYHKSAAPLNYDLILSRYFQLDFSTLIPVLLASYLIGHVISFISSILIEKHVTWLRGVPTNFLLKHGKTPKYFKTSGEAPCLSKCFRFLTALLILPISLIDLIITKLIPISKNYFKPLDNILIEASASAHSNILKKLNIDISKKYGKELSNFDVHKLTIHCSLETAPQHINSIRNYVVLYGFMRSVTLLMILIFWVSLFHLNGNYHWWVCLLSSIILAGICFLFYAAYLKFYIRYHTEGIMALIASHANRDQYLDSDYFEEN